MRRNENLNALAEDLFEDDGSFSISRGLVRSVHYVLVTITTVGYGGIYPLGTYEILYGFILVVAGWFVYMTLVAFFAMMTSYSQFSRIEHTNLVKGTEFLLTKQHPNFVQSNRVISKSSRQLDEEDLNSTVLRTPTKSMKTPKSIRGQKSVDVEQMAHKKQKAKDEEENHQLMLHLQSYYDFVLHHRDGECSVFDLKNDRFDQQNKSLSQMLRSQVLTSAIRFKQKSDSERYEFLEWIPKEAMRGFADHLEWLVIPEKHCISIRQSGPLTSVMFLVTGSLWSPFSKYVFTRHAKDGDRVNKSEIITFNLQCLSPVQMRSAYDKLHAKSRWEKLRADVKGQYVRCDDAMKTKLDGDVVYRRELTEKEVCFVVILVNMLEMFKMPCLLVGYLTSE